MSEFLAEKAQALMDDSKLEARSVLLALGKYTGDPEDEIDERYERDRDLRMDG